MELLRKTVGRGRLLLSTYFALFRNRPAVRFVILGRSRIGSNLLRSLMNAHPQVEAYGEVFRHRDTMDWDHLGWYQCRRMQRWLQEDPVGFVDRRLYRMLPKGTRAVGFKIFYYHAREGCWESVWPYLREKTEIRLLHMKRRNILATHLSRKRAEITNSWVNTTGQREESPAIRLDFEECLGDFERTRGWEEKYDDIFSAHPSLEIVYEELASDNDGQMKRVFEFLGVDHQEVRPEIYKQSKRSLSEAIVNYTDLKRKFEGTSWASFFED